jgi:diguanylate cyclase (GGDEF)-like protein
MEQWGDLVVVAGLVAASAGCWTRRHAVPRAGPIAGLLTAAAAAKLLVLVLPGKDAAASAVGVVSLGADMLVVAAVGGVAWAARPASRGEGPRWDDMPARVARLEADAADADASRRRLEQAMVMGGHGLFEIDFTDRSIEVSEGFRELLGLGPSPDRPFTDISRIVADEDRGGFQAAHRLIELGLARRAAGDFRFRHGDGHLLWVHCRFDVGGRGPEGQPERVLVVATDVSDRKSNEIRLEHMALHDALTGLGNRAAFMRHQSRALPPGTALLLIDLDRFKEVNDSYGHGVGDAWLVEVARRLREVVRREDFVARIGGDEFAVVPAGPLEPRQLDELARRLVDTLDAPFVTQGRRVRGGAGLGAARLDQPNGTAAGVGLFARADAALYEAKTLGRTRYVIENAAPERTPRNIVFPA